MKAQGMFILHHPNPNGCGFYTDVMTDPKAEPLYASFGVTVEKSITHLFEQLDEDILTGLKAQNAKKLLEKWIEQQGNGGTSDAL